MSLFEYDRDFGDEDDHDDEFDWVYDDLEEYVVDEEEDWDALTKEILEDEDDD